MNSGGNATVIVTGAAGGLGRAMTAGLLAAGRSVVAVDIEAARSALNSMVEDAGRAGAGDRIAPILGDVCSEDDCARVVREAISRFGAVDVLVNNAGLGMGSIGNEAFTTGLRFYEIPQRGWRSLIDTNVTGPFLMASAIAPHLIANGWGRIINITTSYQTMLKAKWSPYGPSKAALEAASAIWSTDLEGTGVSVNVLVPGGAADTALVPWEVVKDRSNLVEPSVMVAPVVWLTSRDSDGVTGKRVIGKDWNPADAIAANVARAVSPAAWRVSGWGRADGKGA